ncbi:MAG: YlxR family protein [Deltaproteobacteria bacterium]|nr:YlxR family protein [Deltaproteobacteria bacterium]
MKAKGHRPVRTCISCGAKRCKYDLIRLTTDHENCLVRDDSARLKGRGVYVCKTPTCLERLSDNKRIKRQFRTEADIYVGDELLRILPFDDK